MFHSFWHNVKLTWIKRDHVIPQMNIKMSSNNEKELVLIVVRVPIEFTLTFGKFDVIFV